MQPTVNLIGIILIVIGVLGVGYGGFTYTTDEKIAQIGDLTITADRNKRVNFPPIVGGLCLIAGIVLILRPK